MSAAATPHRGRGGAGHLADVARSELCKLRSVRSTYWTFGLAVAFNVGLAALLAIFVPGQLSAEDKATLDPVSLSLGGVHLSQVAFSVMGVLVITSEYGGGMIRSSLSAVPQRNLLFAAKVGVFSLIALVVATASSFAAYFTFQAALAEATLRTSIGDPGVLRALTGAGLFLALLGLLALGIGAIVRSAAAAIAIVLGLLFVPPVLLELLPQSWQATIGPYVPLRAGSQIFSLHGEAGALAPWAGLGLFALYTAGALAAGLVLINRRDA